MENRKLIKFIIPTIALGLFVIGGRVFAYDTETHAYLTNEIFKFYNNNFSGRPISGELKSYLIDGSRREDDIPRWMNHFYDPVYDRGLTYDPAIDPINLGTWQESKKWAQDDSNQNKLTYKVPATIASILTAIEQRKISAISSKTDFTWQEAVRYWIQDDKERAMFTLGHILHLIEDASAPDHTRNDPHPGDSPYENWTAQFNLNHPDINLELRLDGQKPVALSGLGAYFDNLARYSNNNFYSKDTIGIQSGYQNPGPDYIDRDGKFFYAFKESSEGDYKLFIYRRYYGSILLNSQQDITLGVDEDGYKTIGDYWSRLSVKAVQYGAGAVNLFFEEAEAARNAARLARQNGSGQGEKSFLAAAIETAGNVISVIGGVAQSVVSPLVGLFSPPAAMSPTSPMLPASPPLQDPSAAPTLPAPETPPASSGDIQVQNLQAQLAFLARQLAAFSANLASQPSMSAQSNQPSSVALGGGSDASSQSASASNSPSGGSGPSNGNSSSGNNGSTGDSNNGSSTDSGNSGGDSGTASSTSTSTADVIAPGVVSDLRTENVSTFSLVLLWTAPGDDNASGTAASYDLRYSTSEIAADNWSEAASFSNIPSPSPAGSQESFVVSNLSPGTLYYFALKSADEAGNVSPLSNVVSTQTLALPRTPQTPSENGHPLISEILFDADGGDEGKEFIELYNPTDETLDLAGWSLKYRRNDSTSTVSLASFKTSSHPEDIVSVRSKGFLLVGLSNYDSANYGNKTADIKRSASLPNGALGNDPLTITIYLLDDNDNEKDSVDYDKNSIAVSGQSLERRALEDSEDGEDCISPQDEGKFLGNGCDSDTMDDFETRDVPAPQNSESLSEPRLEPTINNLQVSYSPSPAINFTWDVSVDADGSTSTNVYSVYLENSDGDWTAVMESVSGLNYSYPINEIGRPYNFEFWATDRDGLSAKSAIDVFAPSFLDKVYFYQDPRGEGNNYLIDITASSTRPFWDKEDMSNNQNWKLAVLYLNTDAPKEQILSTANYLNPSDPNFLALNYRGCHGETAENPTLLFPWNGYSCQNGGMLSGAFSTNNLEDPRLAVSTALSAQEQELSPDDFLTVAFYDFGGGGGGQQYFNLAAVDITKYYFQDELPLWLPPETPANLSINFDRVHSTINLSWSSSTDADTLDSSLNYEANYSASPQFDDSTWQEAGGNLFFANLPVIFNNTYTIGVRAIDDFDNQSEMASTTWNFPDDWTPLPSQTNHDVLLGNLIDAGQKILIRTTTTIDGVALWIASDGGQYSGGASRLNIHYDNNDSVGTLLIASDGVGVGNNEGSKESMYSFPSPIILSPGYYWLVPVQASSNTNGTRIYGSNNNSYADGYWLDNSGRDAYFVLRRAE